MTFAFSSIGLIKKTLNQLKDHKLFDSQMNIKPYEISGGFTINLEGRNVSKPKDTVYNWFYQVLSVKKLNFSPMMLIGMISHRFEIDPTKFRQLIDEIIDSLSKKELKDISYYEFYGLCFIGSLLNKNSSQFQAVTTKITEIQSLATTPEDVSNLVEAMIQGRI